MGKRIKVWGWQDPTQVIAQEMAGRAKAKQQGGTMFRDLTEEETEQFQQYARENLPGRSDWSAFHPVCREVWWGLACQHDGLDPKSSFIVFSDDNPYFAE